MIIVGFRKDLKVDFTFPQMASEDEENFKTIVDMKVRAGFMKLSNTEAVKIGYSTSEINELKKLGYIK